MLLLLPAVCTSDLDFGVRGDEPVGAGAAEEAHEDGTRLLQHVQHLALDHHGAVREGPGEPELDVAPDVLGEVLVLHEVRAALEVGVEEPDGLGMENET